MNTPPSMSVADRFIHIFRTNRWKSKESVSGSGSSKGATRELVPQLIDLIDRLKISSMVDAPCGDFNWIGPVAERVSYRGFDIVPEVVEICRSRSSAPFGVANIVDDVLPQSDLILCRDCLVHLSADLVMKALATMKSSGSTWLLTTTFPDLVGNRAGTVGGWRPINLLLEPFVLPPPHEILIERPSFPPPPDYGRKALGLWRFEDLPV